MATSVKTPDATKSSPNHAGCAPPFAKGQSFRSKHVGKLWFVVGNEAGRLN
jgi:hypothetical protein